MLSINCSCWNFLSISPFTVCVGLRLPQSIPLQGSLQVWWRHAPWRPEEFFLFVIPKDFLFHRENDFQLNSSCLNTISKALSQIPTLNQSSTIETGLITLRGMELQEKSYIILHLITQKFVTITWLTTWKVR